VRFEKPETKQAAAKSFWGLYLACLIGMGSHVLLDYTNSYGIRPFWPFASSWHSLDLVFIIDPWILALFLFALGFTYLFRLVNQEVGAHPTSFQSGAMVCLMLIPSYWTVKAFSHRSALRDLESQSYISGHPVSFGAFPLFLNPFGWHGVVETSRAFHMRFAGWSPLPQTRTSGRTRSLYKPEQMDILQAASKGNQAKAFLSFARYPLFQILPTPNGYEVEARDLRFEFAGRIRKAFRYRAELDNHLNILSERFRF